jgi:cell division protein FtsW
LRSLVGRLEDYDGWLLGAVFALCLLGTVMVYEAGSFRPGAVTEGGHLHFLVKQLLRLLLGFGALIALASGDYRQLRQRAVAYALLGAPAALMLYALARGGIGGYARWVHLPGMPVQPIELLKYAVVFYLADRLCDPELGRALDRRLLLLLAVPAGIMLLLALQPNYGSALVIGLLSLAMLFLAGAPLRLLALFVGPAAAAAGGALMVVPKLHARLLHWLAGSSYQVEQSLIGLGAGGWHGFGFGQSRQRFWFLPESHTDFIFSVVGEELGLIGAGLTIALLALIAWRGFGIAMRAPDRFGRLTAGGLTVMLVLYSVLNVGMVTGLLPVIGLPLPFVSYGGSALVTNLAAVGVLLSVDRRGRQRPAAGPRRPFVAPR